MTAALQLDRSTSAICRMLVRGVNWLGDAVMSTPALLRLREAFPAAHISLLTPAKLADLWPRHPALDGLLRLDPRDSIWQVARRIRQDRFDLGVVLPNSPRSALELWLGRVPRRLGYAAAWRRGLLTHALPQRPGCVPMHKRSIAEIRRRDRERAPADPPPPSGAHHIHQYLHLVAAAGANPAPLPPRLFLDPQETEAVARRFGLRRPSEDHPPLLGLNAGAEYGPAKRWPRDRFVAAALALQRLTGCHWVVFGGRGDIELAESIADAIRTGSPGPATPGSRASAAVTSLAGQTSLRELCAALSLCRVVLTNDTGPMHVAAAVGTPVVVPFGSTSAELTGPGLPGDPQHSLLSADVACRPCFRRECPIDLRCMHAITVDKVVAAVLDRLGHPISM